MLNSCIYFTLSSILKHIKAMISCKTKQLKITANSTTICISFAKEAKYTLYVGQKKQLTTKCHSLAQYSIIKMCP